MAALGTQTREDLRETNPLDFQQAMPELFRLMLDFSFSKLCRSDDQSGPFSELCLFHTQA